MCKYVLHVSLCALPTRFSEFVFLLGLFCVLMFIMKNEQREKETTTQKKIEKETPKIKLGIVFHS